MKLQSGILNEKKTKVMIFNYSRDHQFTTRLQLNNHNIEIINETRLLGVQVTDDLKWNRNTEILVKKANQRMQILRKASEFTSKLSDRRQIYILYVRSILEQSCVVWNSSLTQVNQFFKYKVGKKWKLVSSTLQWYLFWLHKH